MKALKTPVTLITLLALQACSIIDSNPLSPKEMPISMANLDQPKSVKAQTFMMRGEVILGHEVRSIQPCGSSAQFWLDLPADKFQQGMKLLSTPYQPIYGEFIGHLTSPPKQGLSADYQAQFIVEQVNLLSTEGGDRCEKQAQPTKAFGTEPFWSVAFQDEQLIFSQPGATKQTFPITTSRLQKDQRQYQLGTGELILNQGSCIDNMSDSLYGWSATFTQGKQKYQGCATLSNQDATQSWVGLYQTQEEISDDFNVSLKINPDHTASTTYTYNDGSNTTERGYWQQLNSKQIQVVMTHHQQQYLVSERLFERENGQLHSDKEKVGNVVYPIANGGLTVVKQHPTDSIASMSDNTQTLSALAIPSKANFNAKVDQTLRNYLQINNTDPDDTRYRWLTYDLNGDGQEELLVQLNWCGSGGCTLLIFDNEQQQWRFNSRITLVQTPLNLGTNTHDKWQDLVLFVRGGGAEPNQHILRYNGSHYPLNPSVAPVATLDEISQVQLFSDGLTPFQEGVKL